MTYYLGQMGHTIQGWHYRPQPEGSLLKDLPSEPQQLKDLFAGCDRALLLIKDGAIENFLNQHPFLRESKTIHFSGALFVEGIENIHPLVSFGPDLFPAVFYQSIPFALFSDSLSKTHELHPQKNDPRKTEREDRDQDQAQDLDLGPLNPRLATILPELPNPSFLVSRREKALYHGLCVASGNLMVLLWQLAGREFQNTFQLSSTHLLPYLQSITTNLSLNWNGALTGPIARRDEETLNKNYVTLKSTPLRPIFEAHVQQAWPEFAKKYFETDSASSLAPFQERNLP